MEQFNRDVYKRETLFQQFYRSCLGKIIILTVVLAVLYVGGVMSVPSDETMRQATDAHVQQCIQDNQNTKNDNLDEFFCNISRTFGTVDTTLTNKESYQAFKSYNQLDVYRHASFATAYLRSNLHPQGIRVGVGIFGIVVSTVRYCDLVLDLGPARGNYNEKLIQDVQLPEDLGENPNLKPYHYKGNPDD